MQDENKNLLLAMALSVMVIIAWSIFFPAPVDETPVAATSGEQSTTAGVSADAGSDVAAVSNVPTSAEVRTAALSSATRADIDTPRLSGSISTLGGRIDDLSLKDYRIELDEASDIVTLLTPEGTQGAYYALYGWAPGGDLGWDDVPGPETQWAIEGNEKLTPETPVTLVWENTTGMTFRQIISVDADFLFSVQQEVSNNGSTAARLAPYSQIRRHGEPTDMKGFFILHEGAIRQSGESQKEYDYSDLADFDRDDQWGDRSDVVDVASNGWLGFTDHYWMTALIPESAQPFKSVLQYKAQQDVYLSETRLPTLTVEAGQTNTVTTHFFAGAKEWAVIREYEANNGIYRFIDSIDWGWFYFLTKPIFWVLHSLNGIIGNMGWSIIGLTLLIKALLFPLAYKSYVSMAKMKELQPQMAEIKEKAGDDKSKVQKEIMELYKKEKVNPASGCLPILLQIPIFFSLYKVIFVTIDLRHAPWVGWIKDLSAPDTSSLFNLFGILPWDSPEPGSIMALIFIGVLPLLLGISMWLQQKLNPAPTDATQAMIFAWMPWVFMFMLGSFASGLVVYWIANNTITFTQQYLIMRSQGFKPDVFGNIMSSFKKKEPVKVAPTPVSNKSKKNTKK